MRLILAALLLPCLLCASPVQQMHSAVLALQNATAAVRPTATHLDGDSTAGATSLSFDCTATNSGDLIIIGIVHNAGTAAPTTPAGFTLEANVNCGTNGGGDAEIWVYEKTSDGTETTITVTLAASVPAAGAAVRVQNPGTSTYTTDSEETSSFALAGVTVPADGIAIQVVGVFDNPNNGTLSAAGGTTSLHVEGGQLPEIVTSYIASDGATGDLTVGWSGTDLFAHWAAAHITVDNAP